MKRKHILLAATLFLILAYAVSADSAAVRRYGLFVGTNDGGSQRQQLLWAVSDANKVHNVMAEVGGIIQGDGMVLENPGRQALINGFSRLSRHMTNTKGDARRVEFVFYYSGHSDETGLLLGDDHVSYSELRDQIKEINSDVSIAILDSCASGAFTRLKGGQRTQPFLADDTSEMTGHAFITSSSDDELSQESDAIEASFFTHYMISALRGAADNSGDRRVTLNEAYEYAFNETLSVTTSTITGPQHPSYNIQLSGRGDLVLTDISNPISSLVLDEELEGRVYIKDGRNSMVAEINKPYAQLIEIALDPGIYNVELVTSEGEFSQHRFNLNYRSQKVLGPTELVAFAPGQNRTRGGEQVDPFIGEDGEPVDSPNESESSFFDDDVEKSFFDEEDDFFGNEDDFFSDVDGEFESVLDSLREAFLRRNESERETEERNASLEIERLPSNGKPSGVQSLTYTPAFIGFVPGIGLPSGNGSAYSTNLGFSPIILNIGELSGASYSGIMTIVTGNMYGANFSGVASIIEGDNYGASLSGVFNIAEGEVNGAQLSGVFNIARGRSSMAQLAGVFNIAEEPLNGAQLSGVFNIADHQVNGAQLAGVFNNSRSVNGAQVAGVLNNASYVNGAQLGLINLTKDVNGLQTGLLNIASGTVRGSQIGLLNIADDMHGVPIGLFSWVNKGIHDISYWQENGSHHFFGLFNGSRNVYSSLYLGTDINTDTDHMNDLMVGLGWGFRLEFKPFYTDLEVSLRRGTVGNNAVERWDSIFDPENPYLYPNSKIVIGFEFIGIGIYLGWSADYELAEDITKGYTDYNGIGGYPTEIPGMGTLHSRFIWGVKL